MSSSTPKIQTPSPITQPSAPTEQTTAPIVQTSTIKSGRLIVGQNTNTSYFRTLTFFLKLACVVSALIGYFSASLSHIYTSGFLWFSIFSIFSFWITIVFIAADSIGFRTEGKIPWIRIQFYYSLGSCILFLLLSATIIIDCIQHFILAGFCGFIMAGAFGYDARRKYVDLFTVTTVVTRPTTIRGA